MAVILCAGIAVGTPQAHADEQNASVQIPAAQKASSSGDSVVVNGDHVEYSMEGQAVTAYGNVDIEYKGARLRCDRIKVNMKTKDAEAEGHVRLDDRQGIVEGKKLNYNFETKKGTIIAAGFRANQYFGRAAAVEKVSDAEFIALKGYATTCDLERPHYRLGARRIAVFPGDKIRMKGVAAYAGDIRVAGIPFYNRSLRDSRMHLRVVPGKKKDWGPYALTSWRYNISPQINADAYLDYRMRLGMAEGLGINYMPEKFGRGDLKLYYTREQLDNKASGASGAPNDFERYLTRWRHRWTMDSNTNFIAEAYKVGDQKRKKLDPDSDFLKDYFYREYERDAQPLSYALLHRNFGHSSLDFLTQMRTNHWFDQISKLPEARYTMPSLQVANTPFYYEHSSSAGIYDKKAETAPVTPAQEDVTRFDMTNKVSLPSKVSFVQITPFAAGRQTLYDKSGYGSDLPIRTVFYTGADLSSRFYRLFDVNSDFLGLDINRLRHVVTPTVGYAYNHQPTIPAYDLKQIDGIDAISAGNLINLGLSNKLQTKRGGVSVDIVDARVSTVYILNPKGGGGSNLSDFLYQATLLPYSWMRFDADATFRHSGNRDESGYRKFSTVNYDASFSLGGGRSIGIGQRYLRGGSNSITSHYDWRLTPKWTFGFYNRYEIGRDPLIDKGFKEEEFRVSRDLHCWIADFTLNIKQRTIEKGGLSFFVVFRLKAFPETSFDDNQSYHGPQSGRQLHP